MKKFIFCILFLISSWVFAAENTSLVVGSWQTVDGKTKKPSSLIKIVPQGKYYVGTVVKTYSNPQEKKIVGV